MLSYFQVFGGVDAMIHGELLYYYMLSVLGMDQ